MSKGPALMQWEIEEALFLRSCGHDWRTIGASLKRDHVGLYRACKRAEMTREDLMKLAIPDREDMIRYLAECGVPAECIALVVGRSVNRVYMDIGRMGLHRRARLALQKVMVG